MLRPFERTAGDEFQGVLDHPAALAAVVERLLREGGWNIGIGIGEVEEPLPENARAGRGPAYLHAREAVTAAKSSPLAAAGRRRRPRQRTSSAGWRRRSGSGRRSWTAVRRGAGRSPTSSTPARRTTRPRSGSASPSRRSASAPRPPASSRDGAPGSSSPSSSVACSEGSTAMSPDNTTQLVLVLLCFALVAVCWAGRRTAGRSGRRSLRWPLAAAAVVAAVADDLSADRVE